jgi:hypothetical protein
MIAKTMEPELEILGRAMTSMMPWKTTGICLNGYLIAHCLRYVVLVIR